MDRCFLLVLCLVTLSNVELGQSQCDGKGIDNAWHRNKMCLPRPPATATDSRSKEASSQIKTGSQGLSSTPHALVTREQRINQKNRFAFIKNKRAIFYASQFSVTLC